MVLNPAMTEEAPEEQPQWQPSYNERDVKGFIQRHKSRPFTEEEIEQYQLREHAQYYNIPFYEGEFGLIDAVKQAAGGFLEGFTTLRTVDAPDNEYEAIIRNLGHLAGFAPGIMAGPLNALKLKSAAQMAGALSNASVPMFGAKLVTTQAKKIAKAALKPALGGRFKAVDSASKFMLGEKAKHIAEGAFHLGIASSISSVWDGVDQMMHSFAGGAMAGGVFRGIGNIIPGTTAGDKAIRGLAGSLFMGLPATQRGATTPEQVYEYLLGAYFGGKEGPWSRAKAAKFMKQTNKEMYGPEGNQKLIATADPKLVKGIKFEEQHKDVQKEINAMFSKNFRSVDGSEWDPGKNLGAAELFLEAMGVDKKLPEQEQFRIFNLAMKGRGRDGIKPITKKDKSHFIITAGDKGATDIVAETADIYGKDTVHYIHKKESGRFAKDKVRGVTRELQPDEYAEAMEAVTEADLTLNRLDKMNIGNIYEKSNQEKLEFIAKNYLSVKFSDQVIAFDYLNKILKDPLSYKSTTGNTVWAVQMGIDKKLPTHVFDLDTKSWYFYHPLDRAFKPVKEAPTFKAKPTIIGNNKIKKTEGKQTSSAHHAIKDLFKKNYEKEHTPDQSPLPDAVDESIATKITSVQKRSLKAWERNELRMTEISDRMRKVKNDLKIAKEETRKDDLNQELGELTKEFAELTKAQGEIIKLKPYQYYDFFTKRVKIDTSTSLDVGEMPGYENAGVRAENFARQHLFEALNMDNALPESKRDAYVMLGGMVNDSFFKHVAKGSTENQSKVIIAEIEKHSEVNLSKNYAAQGKIRQWVNQYNKGLQTSYVRVHSGQLDKITLTDPQNPITINGKKKFNIGPKTILEEIVELEGGDPVTDYNRSLIVFDEVSTKKQGVNTELSFINFINNKRYEFDKKGKILGREGALKQLNTIIKSVVAKMDSKGFVPFGGLGDKERIIFVKEHPGLYKLAGKKVDPNRVQTNLRMALNQMPKTEGYKRALKDWIDNWGTQRQFEKGYLSNVLYDLSINGFNPIKRNLLNTADLRKISYQIDPRTKKKLFIDNAVAFNKRAQILLSPAYEADPEFLAKYIDLNTKKNITHTEFDSKTLERKDLFKYALIHDVKDVKNPLNVAFNHLLPVTTDGAIIVENATLRGLNKDAGSEVLNSQNKSFIIDKGDGKLGAMLGKYMMHPAGKDLSAEMRKKGVNFLIHTSAAKQYGGRRPGSYSRTDKGELLLNAPIYNMNPSSVRYNYGTTSDYKMTKPQVWVKQLFMNMTTQGYGNMSPEIINDVFKTIIHGRYLGNSEHNAMLDSYMKSKNPVLIPELINNFENIGVNKILEIIRTPGMERLSEGFLEKIMEGSYKELNEAYRSGEVDDYTREVSLEQLNDFTSASNRILNLKALRQRKLGYSIYFHPSVKTFTEKTISNWVKRQLMKPKVGNSLVARTRPYEKFYMQHEFPELDNNDAAQRKWGLNADQIYMLDNAYRQTMITTNIPGLKRAKLGDIWDKYIINRDNLSSKEKAEYEDVFESVVLRVPMDSMSGAHKLHFRGFTGIEGFGVALHGRSLEALGGADLDGDEAFVYFGGRSENGKGEGMKKSWKDAIHSFKEEFDVKESKVKLPDLSIKYETNIKGTLDRIVSARTDYKNNQILIDPVKLKEDFNNKVWTKPKVKGVKPLPEDAFKTYEEWEEFVIKHERAHFTSANKALPSGAAKENHANKVALAAMKGEVRRADRKTEVIKTDVVTFDPDAPKGKKYKNWKGSTYEDLLTSQKTGYKQTPKDLKTDKSLYYAPSSRLIASQKAQEGRDVLPSTAKALPTIRGAYDHLMETDEKVDFFETDYIPQFGKKTKIYVKVTPKTSPEAKEHQRLIGLSGIAFGADPMDQGGIKSKEFFWKAIHDAHFKVEFVNEKGDLINKGDYGSYEIQDGVFGKVYASQLDPRALSKGLLGDYIDTNEAWFSKRRFSTSQMSEFEQKQDLAAGLLERMKQNPHHAVNILPKLSEIMNETDYTQNIFRRLNPDKVGEMYDIANKYLSKYKDLAKKIDRPSFKIPYALRRFIGGKEIEYGYVYNVVRHQLFDYNVRRKLADYHDKDNTKAFLEAIQGTEMHKLLKIDKYKDLIYDPDFRFKTLTKLAKQAEDFIMKDMMDYSTIKNAMMLKERGKISDSDFNKIHAKAEELKRLYIVNRAMRDQQTAEMNLGTKNRNEAEFEDIIDNWARDRIFKEAEKEVFKKAGLDTKSSTADQMEIDKQIKEFKKTLGSYVTGKKQNAKQKLFDHFLLGSINRASDPLEFKKALKYVEKYRGKKDLADPVLLDKYRYILRKASSTSYSTMGFKSNEISNEAIVEHLSTISEMFKKSWKQPTRTEIEKSIAEEKKTLESNEVEVMDEGGKPVKEKGSLKKDEVVDELLINTLKNRGYDGIKKAEIDQEYKNIVMELVGHLKQHNDKIGNNLHEVLRGVTQEVMGQGKDLNTFNKQDFVMLNNYFRDLKKGSMWQQIWKMDVPELQKRYYMLFPSTVNKELMKHDIEFLKEEGHFVTQDGSIKKGTIRRPTYHLDILQNWMNQVGSLSVSKSDELVKENGEKFYNVYSMEDGGSLWRIANIQREQGMITEINKDPTTPESQKEFNRTNYIQRLRETEKKHNWKELKTKKYVVINDKGKRIEVTGEEFLEGNPNKNLEGLKQKASDRLEELSRYIHGDGKTLKDKYYKKNIRGQVEFFDSKSDSPKQPKINYRKFIEDVQDMYNRGDEVAMKDMMLKIGVDGMRMIGRSMMVAQAPANMRHRFANWKLEPTGKFDKNHYYPHMFFTRKNAEASLLKAIEHINLDPALSSEQKKIEIRKLTFRHQALTGDWEVQDMHQWDSFSRMSIEDAYKEIGKAEASKSDQVMSFNPNNTFGSMHKRQAHIAGWDLSPEVIDAYSRNLANAYFRNLGSIMSRNIIGEFKYGKTLKDGTKIPGFHHKFGKDLANRWAAYFELYAQDAMGNPSVIPDKLYNDPKMKIKGTPYGWWADNRVLKKVNSMRKTLGINEKKKLPEELKDFTLDQIRKWSNMEAKYELATLLAHPKTAMTNIFGGSMHTIESAGFSAFKKARSIKFLNKINPEWKSMTDVMNFTIKHGVLPEFLVHELGLHKELRTARGKEFIKDMSAKFTDPKARMTKSDVSELVKKHRLSERVVEIAAKFMSIPERTLRRDAFMAHYIRAWEKFGGAIEDPNHPFLIEMAKKGVKATQFLYNAPYRPAFARTALGKVMTRLQLFAWNSTRFRNMVIKEAKLHGFIPGTAGFEKFKRTAQIDLMVLALSNVFMYSIFDNALPPPWTWFQDTANWLFGDEKERDRAFYGTFPRPIAPLQIVSPAILRGPISGIQQWITDDYTSFSEYHIWTMFPFGRMIRDVAKPEQGLIHNPMRLPEKVAGIPLTDLGRKRKQLEEEKEKGTRYKQPKPGLKY